jgi:hypothetical protein
MIAEKSTRPICDKIWSLAKIPLLIGIYPTERYRGNKQQHPLLHNYILRSLGCLGCFTDDIRLDCCVCVDTSLKCIHASKLEYALERPMKLLGALGKLYSGHPVSWHESSQTYSDTVLDALDVGRIRLFGDFGGSFVMILDSMVYIFASKP